MQKQYFVLTAVTVLALAALSCGIQFVGSDPTPVPQGPIPQNFDPGQQGPDNMNPVPQGPNNGDPNGGAPGGNPGQGEIVSFNTNQMTLKKGQCTNLRWETRGGFGVQLDGKPVPAAGQQQVCPTQTTVYGLRLDIGNQMLTREVTITVSGGGQNPNPVATATKAKKNSGGNQPTITDTPSSPFGGTNLQILIIDLGISQIYPAADGHVMVTIQNNGNDTINTTITLSCSGDVTYKGTGGLPDVRGQLGPFTQSFGFTLGAGQKFDRDSQMARDPTVRKLEVTCSITPPTLDNNKANDSKGPVTVKNESK